MGEIAAQLIRSQKRRRNGLFFLTVYLDLREIYKNAFFSNAPGSFAERHPETIRVESR